MTEDEHERLVDVGNAFWKAFSKLVGHAIAQMPAHLESETMMYLQDKTSVYGSDYGRYLVRKASRP